MIRLRLLLFGLLTAALGWQMVVRLFDAGPVWAGAILIALGWGVAFAALPPASERLAAISGAALSQAALVPALVGLLARRQEVTGLAELVAALARLLGLDAVERDGRVILQAGDTAASFLPSLSRLGAFPLLLAVAGIAGVLALVPVSRPGRTLLRTVGALGTVALLRLLAMVVGIHDLPDQGLITSPWLTLAALGTAVLLMPPRLAVTPAPDRRGLLRPAVAAVAGLCWVLALGWNEPGERKAGRILFDDSHGEWEPTATPFDTEHYGRDAAYAYRSLVDLLSWHYPVRVHRQGPLTAKALAGADVLIVKTPTEPFADAEVDAIQSFVSRGGGLFLIGDHTNLFGMTTHINRLARPFGFAFRDDDTYALADEGVSHWRASRWLPHPIAAEVGKFEFETSCTLEVPLAARVPIAGYGLGAEPADYGNPGFFGDLHLDPDEDFGPFVQHAVMDYGRGRVAAFTDSTTFSNFSLFFPGRRELVLSTVEYLNRRSTPLARLPLLAFLAAVTAAAVLASQSRGGAPWAVVAGFALGLVAGTGTVALTGARLAPPPTRIEVPTVLFDRTLARLELPSVLTIDDHRAPEGMDSLIVAFQRLGYLPVVADDAFARLEGAAAVVLAHPRRAPNEEELAALMRFVSNGGSLLVVDGILGRGQGTEELLQPFGLDIEVQIDEIRVSSPSEPEGRRASMPQAGGSARPELLSARPVLSVRGGTPVLVDGDGRAVFSETRFGRGRVGVLVDSAGVSKQALGSRWLSEPTPPQLAALGTAYLVGRRVVEGCFEPAQGKEVPMDKRR